MHRSIHSILNRRSAIAGAAAMPVIAACSPAVAAIAMDPTAPLIRQWRELGAEQIEAYEREDEDAGSQLGMERFEVVERLAATTPTTAKGLAAYLAFIHEYFYVENQASGWHGDVDTKCIAVAAHAADQIHNS